MKNVLVILDGQLAKHLLKRMVDLNNKLNKYDIIYMNDNILLDNLPSNFTLYKFDPTSYSKLSFVLNNANYQDSLILLTTQEETKEVVKNIRIKHKDLFIAIYDLWDLEFHDEHIQYYKAHNVLANGLLEQLPNIPVFAQNIGLREGEIMEIKIPFGSSYAYRYIGSILQKQWKISALYRNQSLVEVKPTLILKPNDIIIVIGNPKVLSQIYSAISKTITQFPLPFGKNIYLYIDLNIQSTKEALQAIHSSLIVHQRIKNNMFIVKVTRPTTTEAIQQIQELLDGVENIIFEVDYYNQKMNNILKKDKIKYDIGLIILPYSFFQYKEAMVDLPILKLPILKLGIEDISAVKNLVVLLNDEELYEQITPIIFDIASQFKIKPKVLDIDPIGDQDREQIRSHFNNLAKIFSQDIVVIQEQTNPIRRLEKENNALQILPLMKEMFKKRTFRFFNTNSNLLSFDRSKSNQILIPVIEE